MLMETPIPLHKVMAKTIIMSPMNAGYQPRAILARLKAKPSE